MFQGDAFAVINLIIKGINSLGPYGHVMILGESFFGDLCKWFFIRRDCNEVAYCLVRQVKFVAYFKY